ncbi:MAG: purine-binding chemotaxis protein CheW [Bdellovibrionales bacterium]|nr:purine-binding chemotaxis protein CheW [Bdellovibrionales bacterium]
MSNSTERFLLFSLGKEDYGMPLLTVREVIAIPNVTPIPHSPSHFLGLMNLRGQVISVLDLRQKLGIKPTGSGEASVIICDLAPLCLGVVVDSINSVLAPEEGSISDPPDSKVARNVEYITGVCRNGDKLVLLVDISKALSVEDVRAIKKAA